MSKYNIRQIILESFPYLFNKFGFKEVYYNNRYGRYGEGFLVGVQHGTCRLLFVKEPELRYISTWVGLNSAPFEKPDIAGTEGWFNLPVIGHFISGNKMSVLDNFDKQDEVFRLKIIGNYLETVVEEIMDHFKGRETVSFWLDSYYDFVKNNYPSRK